MSKFQITILTVLTMLCLGVPDASLAKEMSQGQLQKLATHLAVKYQLTSNVDVAECQQIFDGPCFQSKLIFSLPETQQLNAYTLYFSHIAPIKWDGHDALDIVHINGDLHQIAFSGTEFSDNTSITIDFKAAAWHASKSDIMPNYFIVADGLTPEVIVSTKPSTDAVTGLQTLPHAPQFSAPKQYRRGADDLLPLADAQWLYSHYEKQNVSKAGSSEEPRIIPNVEKSIWSHNTPPDLSGGLMVHWGEFVENSTLLGLLQSKGLKVSDEGVAINIIKDNSLQLGQYQLDIGRNEISLKASCREGVQYGFVSLYHLINQEDLTVPSGTIDDTPRYDFRGVHMDLSRNFLGKGTVLKLINQMFLLKLNKLHLHLADDEGWRLQLARLPELTEIGGYRCFDPAEDKCLLPQLGSGPQKNIAVNGYLSESDYLEIIQYAHERHIEIIPSFDLPGHARAAVKSMEARYRKFKAKEDMVAANEFLLTDFQDDTEYSSVQFYQDNTVNPCMESTYHFVDTVIGDVKALHARVNVPLTTYHIGADETAGAWKLSPVCKSLIADKDELNGVADLKPYFLNRVLDIVEKHGLKAAGWSDGMHKVIKARANEGHQVNVWDTLFWGGHKIADEFNQHGWDTVLSIPDVNYFDFPYQNSPDETGYYWASKNTDEFKVFQFMPDNLAANAVQWTDRKGNPFSSTLKDTAKPVKGIQTQIWTEAVRTPETFDYLMFPRLHSFAERAWHKAEWELDQKPGFNWQYGVGSQSLMMQQREDWLSFSWALLQQAQAMGSEGINVRIPPPGAKIDNGKLYVNSPWPGLIIEFKVDYGNWQRYSSSVPVSGNNGKISVRAMLPGSTKTSRVLEVTVK